MSIRDFRARSTERLCQNRPFAVVVLLIVLAITASMSGLLFGALYLASGHNLWTAIIAHGVNDTVGFALIYLGKYPGL